MNVYDKLCTMMYDHICDTTSSLVGHSCEARRSLYTLRLAINMSVLRRSLLVS